MAEKEDIQIEDDFIAEDDDESSEAPVEVAKTNLTKRRRELLAEFEEESSGETHPESHGFFAKVKDFLDNLGT